MLVANAICIVGSGLLVGLPVTSKWGRLVALWLCFFQGLGFSISLTMVSSNVAGWTKKQITGAILFIGFVLPAVGQFALLMVVKILCWQHHRAADLQE